MFAAVLGVWAKVTDHIFLTDPISAIQFELPLQVTLFVTYGVICLAWVSLHSFGFVGGGSGAGFRLMLLALLARTLASMVVLMAGGGPEGSVYSKLPSISGLLWWVRNGSLFTFGLGIGLVVLASGADLARRRRRPRWVPFSD